MLEKLSAFLTGIVMTVGSFFGIGPDQNQPPVDAPTIQEEESFGGFSPVGGTTYRLKTSVGTTDTTIVLSSLRVDGIPVTMSTLNTDIGYATLDPQSETRKEFVSFTTITQNADGSATLTGVSRGLAGSYPYTASSTLRNAHPGQSIFVLSDAPQVFNEYTRARSNETITGQWTFTNFPITASSSYASPTTTGWVELATGAEAASSTGFGATGSRLALNTIISTSTAPSSGHVVPVTRSNGTLDSNFIPNFSGTTTFSGNAPQVGQMYMTAGETINGATLPVPVYQNATNTLVYPMAGGGTTTQNFVGFAVTNGTANGSILVQQEGIVSGFTGLSGGNIYYVSNATGTISTTEGAVPFSIGKAINSTQLAIQRQKRRAHGTVSTVNDLVSTQSIGFKPSIIRAASAMADSGGITGRGVWTNGTYSSVNENGSNAGNIANPTISSSGLISQSNTDGGDSWLVTVANVATTSFALNINESGAFNEIFIMWEAEE